MNTRQNSRASAGSQNQTTGSNAPAAQSNAVVSANPKLMTSFAAQYGIDANKMVGILRATAFKASPPATDEEIAALVVVANIYHLNPFLRECYAFRNKSGGITPIVGIDGWVRIVESQPTYEGEEMKSGYDDTLGPDGKELGFYYECFIHRSDRKFPTSRRQYYKENYRNTEPWNMMPTRMLQHRAYIQSARAAFGLGGIYDEDEGERIASAIDITPRDNGGTKPATRPPRELPPQDTGRTLDHQPSQTVDQPPTQQSETVSAGDPGQTDAFRSLATEPPSDEEMEPGSRG